MTTVPVPNYQTPYSNSPYGAGVPSSVPPQMNMPPNYAMGGGMPMQGFPMHPGQMNPQQQQMMQRMQPPQPNAGGMPNPPQRQFSGQEPTPGPQGTPTPNSALAGQQPQFSTPRNSQGPPQNQVPGNPQQAQQQQQQQQQQPPPQQQQQPQPIPLSGNIQTPQTPTFPPNVQGTPANGTAHSTPLSPGGDARDKERIAVILEINNELLWEATQCQNTHMVLKKEGASHKDAPPNETEARAEEEKLAMQDFQQ
jgi:hypothetical protein